jgi:hypothetical protein
MAAGLSGGHVTTVRVGIGNGLTKEELVKSVDLDHHPVYGKNKVSTARSVGAMYDKLKK